ncbi:transposase, MuDR, MULE transposase domain protein [Tanacetum coccineum]
MTKAKDQRSQSMKEQAYNIDRDKDHKSLSTKAISLISRRSVTMNSLQGRLLASNIKSNTEVRSFRILSLSHSNMWSRAHCPANRYNYLTSNSAESVNSLSRRARKLPVTHLMEFFRALLQRWYYERRYEGDVDEHELTPWAAAKVAYRIRMSFGFSVHGINSTKYQVVAEEINYIVDLRSRTCTCRRWQLSGLPCSHVIAVSTNKGYTDLGVWAEHWFKKTTYKSTYANSIYPVGDVEAWNTKCNVPNVLPPSTNTRPAGRPKKKDRIRSKGEMPKKTYCSRCNSGGHDRNACHEPAPSQRSTYGWDKSF